MRDQRSATLDDSALRTRWLAYGTATGWAICLIALGAVMPSFKEVFAEIGITEARQISFRAVVYTPRAVWILLGLSVGGALFLAPWLFSAERAQPIAKVAFWPYIVFVPFVAFTLLRPLVACTNTGRVWPLWLPF